MLFAVLMVIAAVLALLPVGWTRWLRGPTQLLSGVQAAGTTTLRTTTELAAPLTNERLPVDEAERLLAENDELQRLAGSLSLRVNQLEDQLDELTVFRGVDGGIIIAPVIGYDASPRKDTLTIAKGSLNTDGRLQLNQWVTAGRDPRTRPAGALAGELLMRQWVIGQVVDVQPYTAKVRLLSDPRVAGVPVRVARIVNGGWQPSEKQFLLDGAGRGRMQIRKAAENFAEQGFNIVLIGPTTGLPLTLSAGRVGKAEPIPEAPLIFNVEVLPWDDPRRLAHVYVITTGP